MIDTADVRQEFYVYDEEQLATLCEQLRGSPWLAVDTEFLREKTYYPKLCLLQIANDKVIACVDPLRIADLSPLLDILFDENSVKILHSARQDYEIFFHLTGRLPAPVFDTQVAAAICRGDEQISYAALVEQVVGKTLEKDCTRTDWTQRPLSDQQLNYAQDDVRYLGEIYQQQLAEMQKRGVANWHEAECAVLIEAATYQAMPQNMWLRVKESRRMRPSHLPVLQLLTAWREEQAIKRDKPRKWVLRDDVIVELVRRQPESGEDLRNIKGVSENFLTRHEQTVLSLIQQAKQLPKDKWPTLPKRVKRSIEDEAMEDVMMALIRKCAMDHGVASSILGGRKDLEALLDGNSSCRFLHGWRYEAIGKTLQDFLHGDITVTVESDHLKIEQAVFPTVS